MAHKNPTPIRLAWRGLLLTAFLAGFFYVLMEWLFAVTKPSFMNVIAAGKQVEILLFIGALAGTACVLVLALPAALSLIPGLDRLRPALIRLGGLLPAGVLAAAALLLVDNFTYTLFGYGIVSTAGPARALYAVGFLALLALLYYQVVMPAVRGLSNQAGSLKRALPPAAALALISLALPFILGDYILQSADSGSMAQARFRPHILLLTSDGVNANHMSVYGYERETTPNMDALRGSLLLAENNFTNSGNTAGSLISVFTGKYPANTRFIYPPYILNGVDAYQHLPGILKTLGYRTVQIGSPHFVDAYAANMQGAFDYANGRSMENDGSLQKRISRYLPTEFAYFTYETANRIVDRLRHIFFLKQMENPYQTVTDTAQWSEDGTKLNLLLGELQKADQPLFAHVHFLGTHGATFKPREQVFSAGKDAEAQEPWDMDFYDDSIHDFDYYVGYLVKTLEEQNLLDDTVLVIGSDHGLKSIQTWRIPLLIRFPDGARTGSIQVNTQNLDIAPTILDYLGMGVPVWMDGRSLLDEELPQRPIISVAVAGSKTSAVEGGYKQLNVEKIGPPFYQINFVDVMGCPDWYALNLADMSFASGRVAGYSGNCPDRLSGEQALDAVVEHLNRFGYDTSSLSDSGAILAAINQNGRE